MQIITTYVYADILNDNTSPWLVSRAIWLLSYFTDQDGMTIDIVNKVFQLMHTSNYTPVKVDAAICIAEMVSDQSHFVELIKPALNQLLTNYLRIMDTIEMEELVDALKTIIDVYGELITPYALEVATKLGDTYMRLIQTTSDKEDSELMMTAAGCLKAINKILYFAIDCPSAD